MLRYTYIDVLLNKAAEHELRSRRPDFYSEAGMYSEGNVTGPLEKVFARISSIPQQMLGWYANSALYCTLFHVAHSKLTSKFIRQSQPSLPP
jgi:hypothetical protein